MRVPSGDHDGSVALAAAITLCWPVPSAFMIQTPPFGRAYTICVASGDQSGSTPGASTAAVCGGVTVTTRICFVPVRSSTNRMRFPSGDHAGEVSPAALLVSRVKAVPSALTRQIWDLPERAETNTSWVPSGDQAGWVSAAFALVSRVWPLPSADIT